MKYTIQLCILLCLILTTCSKPNTNKLEIKTGTICGFCGGDTLLVDVTTTMFKNVNYCNDTTLFLEEATGKEAWDNILSSFSWEAFNAEDINTCNICVDGCDTWIFVKEDEKEHRISYGQLDEIKDAEIREFAQKLVLYRTELNQRASVSE